MNDRDEHLQAVQDEDARRRLAAARELVGLRADGTRDYSVPSSAIPERIFSGGRDNMALAVLVAGYDAIESATRSWVQNHLIGKTSKEIEADIRPGTILGDVLNSPVTAEGKTLDSEVRDFVARLRASEENAELLGKRDRLPPGRANRASPPTDLRPSKS